MVVCSDEFGPLARAESQVLGLPSLPLVAIPHPLAGNLQALVEAKANAIASDLIAALSDSAARLQARFAGQFLDPAERRLEGGAVCVDEVCAVDPAVRSA